MLEVSRKSAEHVARLVEGIVANVDGGIPEEALHAPPLPEPEPA